ncbi:GldL-related protein [Winogradskyella wichelsiae]|uniref:GldL-related protein n=1 Tax=Winogradskyella wichelsiae TaxID=2697007 RepID=UPI003EF2803C
MPYLFEILLLILFIYWFIIEGPVYIKNRKFTKNRFLKVCYKILIALTAFMVFFGLLFKIQHWPYGSLLFVLGILSLNILLFLDYFLIDRSQLDKE